MSVQVSEGRKEREGKRGGNLTRYWTEREGGGGGGGREMSLLHSCCHGDPSDNAHSLRQSGTKDFFFFGVKCSAPLTPPLLYHPCKRTPRPCQNQSSLRPHSCFQPLAGSLLPRRERNYPGGFKLKPDECCFNHKKIKEKIIGSPGFELFAFPDVVASSK